MSNSNLKIKLENLVLKTEWFLYKKLLTHPACNKTRVTQ